MKIINKFDWRQQRHRKGTVARAYARLGAGWVGRGCRLTADALLENAKCCPRSDAFGGVTDANGVLDRPSSRKSCFPICKAAAAQRNHRIGYIRTYFARYPRRACPIVRTMR